LVTVSITSNTGAAGATLDGTLTVSAINGMATFTDLGIDAAGSGYTLTAYKDILAVAVSSPFSVSPVVVTEPPTLRLRLSPPTEPTTVSLTWDSNDPLSEIAGYKIQAVYQDNNPEASITGYNELDSTPFSMDPFQSQANSPSDNVTSYTLDVGNVTSYTLSGLNEGTTYDFTVSAYDSDGNEFLFSTDAPATPQSLPTTLAFLTQPSGAMPGSSFATQPMVVIQDIEGNIVTSATDLVTVSITSNTGAAGATLDGTLTVSAINGMATFMDLGIDAVGSGYTLTADSGSLPLAVSSPFNVLPVVVTELTFAEGTGDYVNVPLTNDMGNVTIKMYWDKDENGVDF
jgi:hypothetical protein